MCGPLLRRFLGRHLMLCLGLGIVLVMSLAALGAPLLAPYDPNALLPVITLLGLSVPGLIGGSVIIESIFALPGLGQLFYAAVMARDYTIIMGNLVLGAVLTLLGNLLADVCYGLADPRIRSSREVR